MKEKNTYLKNNYLLLTKRIKENENTMASKSKAKKEKKYYWIKLKTDFFTSDLMDYIVSQKNGCEYIVLYQMLCLKTANNNGELSTQLGEIHIPYDIDKIVRDTKYFDFDTVAIAFDLFKKLGLIYESYDKPGIFVISDFEELVGSISVETKRKREYRQNKLVEKKKNK